MSDSKTSSYLTSFPITLSVNQSEVHLLIDTFANQFIQQLNIGNQDLYTLKLSKKKPIRITKIGSSFDINLHLEGLVKGKGLLLKSLSASGEINIDIQLQYQYITPSSIKLNANIKNYSWIKKPVLNAIGLDINIRSITDALLSKVIKDAQQKINHIVNAQYINVTKIILDKNKTVPNLTFDFHNHPMQINFKKLKIEFSDLENEEGLYTMSSIIRTDCSMHNQDTTYPIDLKENFKIELNQKLGLPKANKTSIPMTIGYELINHLIQTKIKELKLELLSKQITIKDVIISFHSDQKIKCDIRSDYNILEHFQLTFRPSINPTSNQLTIHDLEINLMKTTFLGKTIMLADNMIINQIYKKINPIKLDPILKDLNETVVFQAVEKAKVYNLDVLIENDDIKISDIAINENDIHFNLNTILKLTVLINNLQFNNEH